MKLIEIQWNPSAGQLRQFGVVCFIVLPLIGWIWNATPTTIGVLGTVGLVVGLTSLLDPKAVKPIFVGLSLLAIPIGMVLGELAMLLIYFGVFLTIGLAFRLMRRDALQLHGDRDADTYWQPKKQSPSKISYYRQF